MKLISLSGVAAVALALGSPALAADYPNGSVTIYVGHGAGGNVDTMSRLIAASLTEQLGADFVVVNRGGAGGAIAAKTVADAKPDGQTLGFTINETFSYVPLANDVGYDIDSFDYLGLVGRFQTAYVTRSENGWNNFEDMLEEAKAEDRPLTYSSILPLDKLIASYMTREWGVRMIPIPAKSGGEMVQQLLGGHVDYGFSGGIHATYVDAGDMLILASTHADGLAAYEALASLKTLGIPVSWASEGILAAPDGLPSDVSATLEAALKVAYESEEFQSFLKKAKLEPRYRNASGARAAIETAAEDFRRLIAEIQ